MDQDDVRVTGSSYEPFQLRAFCLHKRRGPADAAARIFRDATGRAPRVTLESASWTVEVGTGGGTTVGWDGDGRVAVVLHGEIHDDFGDTAEALARRFRVRGRRLLDDLNGSFALLVLDREADRLLVATDRVRSRRVFHGLSDGGHWLTSDLKSQRTGGRQLDVTGLAWYMVGGAFYNGRTPFEGIRVLDPGTCFDVRDGALRPERYWSHVVREPEGDVDLDRLADELGERLVEAVRRRASGDLVMSLSGGHDSTAIAVILTEVLGITDVRTFSYVSRREYGRLRDFETCPEDKKDAFVAARTARLLGLPHRIVETYRGDLMAHLRRNADWTQGMARGWSAADAWTLLDDELAGAPDPVILVGDEYLGTFGTDDLPCEQAVWHDAHIRDLAFPMELEGSLPRDVVASMRRGLESDKAEILERQEHHGDLFRMQDHLIHEQRNVNVILPWREHYAGRFGKVRNPLMDSDVLDLVTAVPQQARRGKSLFLEAMGRLSPTFRDFVRSDREAYHPDFGPLLRTEAPALRAWISSSRSRLDAVIPVAFGEKLLDMITDPPGRWSVPRLGTAVRRRARNAMSNQQPRVRGLRSVALFRSWAILRMALED
jgi:hypothetical protein